MVIVMYVVHVEINWSTNLEVWYVILIRISVAVRSHAYGNDFHLAFCIFNLEAGKAWRHGDNRGLKVVLGALNLLVHA